MATGFGFVFETEWEELAQTYVTSRGYGFSEGCLSQLRVILAGGLRRAKTDPTDEEIIVYDSAVVRFVETMIEEAEDGGGGDRILHEWTVERTRLKLCPLFPFC